MTSPAQLLLAHLQGVRPSGNGWSARCPAHEDRLPSLSVSEGDDGRALVHCFGGCEVAGVLAAVGLTLADLFPERIRDCVEERRHAAVARKRIAIDAAVGTLAREGTVVAIAARMIESGEPLTLDDIARVTVAAIRLRNAREVLK